MGQLLCEPLAERQNPKTAMDAKWSIPFSVAVAALRGKVKIADFTPAGFQDPEVLRLARRVKPRFDAGLVPAGRGWTGIPPGIVEIRTIAGERHRCRVDVALGYGSNPMTREHHVEKFRDCASYSAKPLSDAEVDTVIGLVDRLEELDDVADIVRMLS